MPVKPVVTNTTPLVSLWLLDRLDILRSLFGETIIPPGVQSEFLAAETAVREAALNSAPWIRVVKLSQPQRALVYSGLDHGEAEVLALAEEQEARLVIIDERSGRRFASRLRLPLTGTLGVLLLAKESGLVETIDPSIRTLRQSGMYLGEDLIERVLQIAGEK
ncbi:MAG: DUF3368 domain-containing protein [Anaerolineales bacterium]